MRRPTKRADVDPRDWGDTPLKEAQVIWDRAFRKSELDVRAQFLAELKRELSHRPSAMADYRKAIRAPLAERPEDVRRYRELETRYQDRPLEIWTNPTRRKPRQPKGYDDKGIPFTYGFDGERLQVGDRIELADVPAGVWRYGVIVGMVPTERDRVRVEFDNQPGQTFAGAGNDFRRL